MRRPSNADPSLPLIPFMSLASLLIPMLLMGAQFITLGVIDSAVPAICSSCEPDPEADRLGLTIAVTDEGLHLTGEDPSLAEGLSLPCAAGRCEGADDYDTDGLLDALSRLKERHPEEGAFTLLPESTVDYETLVLVMDISRGPEDAPLFPSPVIAGGER